MVEQIQEAQALEEAEKASKLAGETVIINLTNEDGEKSDCGSFQYAEIHRTSPNDILQRKFSSRGDLSVIVPLSRKGSSMRHRFSDIEKWDLSSRKVTPTLLRVPNKGSNNSISSMRIDLLAGELNNIRVHNFFSYYYYFSAQVFSNFILLFLN